MKSFLIQENDIVRSNGNPVQVANRDAYLQRLRHRVKTFLGEIPWAENTGVPWEVIYEKPVNPERVGLELQKAINADPDTVSSRIDSIEIDRAKRRFTAKAVVRSVYGEMEFTL